MQKTTSFPDGADTLPGWGPTAQGHFPDEEKEAPKGPRPRSHTRLMAEAGLGLRSPLLLAVTPGFFPLRPQAPGSAVDSRGTDEAGCVCTFSSVFQR